MNILNVGCVMNLMLKGIIFLKSVIKQQIEEHYFAKVISM